MPGTCWYLVSIHMSIHKLESCAWVWMHPTLRAYTHAYAGIEAHVYTHTYAHVYTHVYTHAYANVDAHIYTTCLHTRLCTY